jgi:plasmid stabilization system protein ParE
MAGTYTVIITPKARKDIFDALEYLSGKLSTQEVAKIRQSITDAVRSLEKMPEACSPVRETAKPDKPVVLRQVVAKKVYRIIFRIDEPIGRVIVIRVIHAKRGMDFVKNALG